MVLIIVLHNMCQGQSRKNMTQCENNTVQTKIRVGKNIGIDLIVFQIQFRYNIIIIIFTII